jgi:hypothetical protein
VVGHVLHRGGVVMVCDLVEVVRWDWRVVCSDTWE